MCAWRTGHSCEGLGFGEFYFGLRFLCLRIKLSYYVSLKYSNSTKAHYVCVFWVFFCNSLHYFLYPMTNACRKSLLNPAF